MTLFNSSGQRSSLANEEACIRVLSLDDFIHLSLFPAFVIVLVLSLCQRRANVGPDSCCGGRPGLLVPANLLDDTRDRLAYAAAFGATATSCLTLFSGSYCPPGTPGWLAVFYAIAKVVELGIDYYPFFACMSTSSTLLGAVIGLLYSVVWFLFYLSHALECLNNQELWYFPGQPLVEQFPVLICLLVLVLQYAHTSMRALLHRCRAYGATTGQTEQSTTLSRHHAAHVRELLRNRTQADERKWRIHLEIKLFSSLRHYRPYRGFVYSSRIVSTFLVATICLYEFGILSFVGVNRLISSLQRHLVTYSGVLIMVMPGPVGSTFQFLAVSRGCYMIAFCVSSALMLCYMLHAFVTYRTHLLRLQRGDTTFLPRSADLPHPGNMLSESMKYSGIQIAYFLWGYYMLQLMLYLVAMVMSYFLVLPLLGLVSSLYLEPLWTVLPTVVLSLLVNYVQIIVSRKALLQDHFSRDMHRGSTVRALALNNRRVYHNFTYFLFFFNILLGLYSCLLRIAKSILLGLVFLARIDHSGLMQGFQHWDYGYMSYVSFLYVEHAHCHPVLVSFCRLLLEGTARGRSRQPAQDGWLLADDDLTEMEQGAVVLATPRARLRWWKAYTLLRNPQLQRRPLAANKGSTA